MANHYGDGYDPSDPAGSRYNGAVYDAGVRMHRVVVDFTDTGVGGTTNPVAAYIREGNLVIGAEVTSDQSLAGINISVGISGTAAKYSAAAAGPAANVNQVKAILASALDNDALSAPETVLFTPSGNWPSTGKGIFFVKTTKRG